MPARDHIRHLPNVLTVLRILATPAILVLMFSTSLAGRLAALVLFILAAISDYADGEIARRLSSPTRIGRFLDPLADKVLVLGTFCGLALLFPNLVPWWAVGVVALRDIVVTSLRMRAEARGRSIRTLPMAKTKTTVQLVFLIGMLAAMAAAKFPGAVGRTGGWVLDSPIPLIVLLVVVAITAYTGAVYLYRTEYVTN
jgi:CDP-diacylglycerol--glycerol-3-phosphate 3-phosphatidyltransferase